MPARSNAHSLDVFMELVIFDYYICFDRRWHFFEQWTLDLRHQNLQWVWTLKAVGCHPPSGCAPKLVQLPLWNGAMPTLSSVDFWPTQPVDFSFRLAHGE